MPFYLLIIKRLTQFRAYSKQRQTDDSKVIAFNSLNQAASDALNSITSSLIERLFGVHISSDLLLCQLSKKHLRVLGKCEHFVIEFKHAAGVHDMPFPVQLAQHVEGICSVFWLSINLAVHRHNRVGSDDAVARVFQLTLESLTNLFCLSQRDGLHVFVV
jgi:hypothetical protein